MSIDLMVQRIDDYDDKSIGNGATEAEIAEVEQELGHKLPISYRTFLGRYGWARFASNEFYGVGTDVPEHLRLSTNTIAERTTMLPTMKSSLMPILNDGAGNHYCLATDRMSDVECPVVFWDHGEGPEQQATHKGDSFDKWIVEFLNDI